jgi:rubredoxin
MTIIYRCKICNYIYDQDEKALEFKDLSENYCCPKCSASKESFVKKEIKL